MGIENIRNFCIVAHIDHGKSTLADRILELTGAVDKRKLHDQYLDSHSIEKERGITIKAKAVALNYKGYQLNLIDTPGHVDFSYEVSRSLAACEGAILLVDATQGVQAQTVANCLLAIEAGLDIIPVINKIDLQHAMPEETFQQLKNLVDVKQDEVFYISAKEGNGVETLLDSLITRVSKPTGDINAPLQALIFDSNYDEYRGVVVYVRIKNGSIKKTDRITFLGTGGAYEVLEVGIFKPQMEPVHGLKAGEVGYIIANIKSIRDVRTGDTVTLADNKCSTQLPGYKEPVPMVFCGLYPSEDSNYEDLQKGIEKLSLNDSAFTYQPVVSDALGPGYHVGFLGLLHMDIVQERLGRDQGVSVVKTSPNVTYEVVTTKKDVLKITNVAQLPPPEAILEWREPFVQLKVITLPEYIGPVKKLIDQRRGQYVRQEYIGTTRVLLTYDVPFGEIVYDFYDRLKSVTKGYGTMDYVFIDYFPSDLVRIRILVAGQDIDALSAIVHRDNSEIIGRKIIKVLRKEIPRHIFEVPLQAAIGGKIIARESIKPVMKNVIGKCYGGDYTRKAKLLNRQKEGKKRMKAVGRVDIPQEAFMAVLRASQEE